jgi:hypothetical protein
MENLALRHQLLVLKRTVKAPTHRNSDRLFWAALSVMWSRWTKVLVIVQPQTVVRWHQAGFRLFWRWKSRRRTGRTTTNRDLIELIRRMWQANPTWGSPRIRAELEKLGLQVSAATVRKYRPKGERGPSVWRSNHSGFDRKRAGALAWTLPCPRRRPANPYLEYRAICHAGPAIPSAVHHDWGQQAPRSSRKIHRVSPRGCRMEFLSPTRPNARRGSSRSTALTGHPWRPNAATNIRRTCGLNSIIRADRIELLGKDKNLQPHGTIGSFGGRIQAWADRTVLYSAHFFGLPIPSRTHSQLIRIPPRMFS